MIKDNERAEALAEYGKQLMGIYGWDYSKYMIVFSAATEQKDADRCMELRKIMLSCLEKPINQTDSLLYTHLRKEMEKKEYKCMSKAILVAIVSLVLGILAEASVGVS